MKEILPVPGTPGTRVTILTHDPQSEGVLVAHTVITAGSQMWRRQNEPLVLFF